MTHFRKEDDYTIAAITDIPEGTLCRYFNFAAEEVMTVLIAKAADKDQINKDYSSSPSVSTSVSVAITSQLAMRKFSDFDSQKEISLMRKELLRMGGRIPEEEGLDKKSPPWRSISGLS